jgi:DNA-binding XRE family transcriptional regulator
MDFKTARLLSRMTLNEVAEFLGLSTRTVYNYEKENKAPKAVITCLSLIGGFMPEFGKRNDFSGWSFGSGYLWPPEGDKFTSGDIRAGSKALLSIELEYDQLNRKRLGNKRSNIVPIPFKRNAVRENS